MTLERCNPKPRRLEKEITLWQHPTVGADSHGLPHLEAADDGELDQFPPLKSRVANYGRTPIDSIIGYGAARTERSVVLLPARTKDLETKVFGAVFS
jgi:hypothetical protein